MDTPTAICTPARASLLTGQCLFRHRLLANYERNVGYLEDLRDDAFTFPAALAERDYQLGLIGQWHGGVRHATPRRTGSMVRTCPVWHNLVDHPDYLSVIWMKAACRRTGSPTGPRHHAERQPRQSAGRAVAPAGRGDVRALPRHPGHRAPGPLRRRRRPFFLATHFFGPHLPYLLPDEYFDLYDPELVELPPSIAETFEGKPPVQRNYSAHWTFDTIPIEVTRKLIAVYWGYVTLIDEQIGRILTRLDELGLTDGPSVFFTADHGEFTGAHRLHDKGPAMYEDIYRIPGIIRIPGATPQVRHEFVTLTDCTATILDLAGCDPAPAVDSRSLAPLVRGEPPEWPGELIAEFHGHHFPYPQRMIRDERYKLVVNPESVNELYDLVDDPHELSNRYPHPNSRRSAAASCDGCTTCSASAATTSTTG